MLIDDRLNTVLRICAEDEATARAQLRQLLNLMGSLPEPDKDLPEEAYSCLGNLLQNLPEESLISILKEAGLKLNNPRLIAQLVKCSPRIAEAALDISTLSPQQWRQLLAHMPQMDSVDDKAEEPRSNGALPETPPLPAFSASKAGRKFAVTAETIRPLNATAEAKEVQEGNSEAQMTERAVLPRFAEEAPTPSPAPSAVPAQPVPVEPAPRQQPVLATPSAREIPSTSLSDLVDRMERLRQSHRPSLARSLSETAPQQSAEPDSADIATDSLGSIVSASGDAAPHVVGLTLGPKQRGSLCWLDNDSALLLRRMMPLRGAMLTLDEPSPLAGEWRLYAAPQFDPETGAFAGYAGRVVRQSSGNGPAFGFGAAQQSDAIRQLLHELRTPVNAIQGFAEVIQQQLFGRAPHEYRAMAAAITMDAALLLAGFDEMERYARLQSGDLELEHGSADLRLVLRGAVERVNSALAPYGSGLALRESGDDFTVGIATDALEQMIWRLVAALAGSLAQGETVSISLRQSGKDLRLAAELPQDLRRQDDVFQALAAKEGNSTAAPEDTPASKAGLSAGMFGTGYSLRLTRAEAKALGGTLQQQEDRLELTLPAASPELSEAAQSTRADRESEASAS